MDSKVEIGEIDEIIEYYDTKKQIKQFIDLIEKEKNNNFANISKETLKNIGKKLLNI